MGIVIRQSFKATLISYLGACIGALLVIFIYPKCLTPEQIGLTRILTEAALLFSFFSQLGMNSIAIKFFPFFKDSKNAHNGFLFIISFFPFVGFVFFLVTFPFFKNSIISLFEEKSGLFTTYVTYLIPLTFFWIYITLCETYASLLQRIVVPKFIKEILIRILTIAAILLFFLKIISFSQFVFIFSSIYGIAALLNIIYINSIQKINLKPHLSFINKPLRREMLVFMLFMMAFGIGSSISTKIDVFMLSQKVSLSGTGIFTIAFFIASFIEMPTRAIYQITTPLVSDALKNNDMAKVDSFYKRVAINQLIIAGFLFLLIWANASNIFKIMPNGHIYEGGKYVILFIGISKIFDAATGINAAILGYSKYYYYTLFFIFILAILAVVNNLIFIPLYGIVGSAIATAISILLYNTFMIVFVKWKLKLQPFSNNTIIALLMIVLMFVVNIFIPDIANPFIDSAVRSVLLIIIFVIAVFKLKISKDINDLMLNIFNRGIRILNSFKRP